MDGSSVVSHTQFQNSGPDRNLHSIHGRRNAQDYKKRLKEARKKKTDSFATQEVELKDYIISPEGWEGIMFAFYFLTLPYVTGVIFLFLFVAQADMHNFLILDITHFFIVWAIGYEIVATVILILIFISYIRYIGRKEKLTTDNRLKKR
jgi:hypothetical protein